MYYKNISKTQAIIINGYDIETFIENDQHVPYCIVLIFNKKYKYFYINNSIDIIKETIIYIFANTKKKKIFYIHNLDYDGLFILEYLTKFGDFKFESFIRKKNIYSIKIYNKNKIIEFKCSYKLLPSSLRNIAKSFNLDEKMPFPYKFSNRNNLEYVGVLPSVKYFNSYDEWLKMNKNSLFNFKEYSLLYCERDVLITIKFVKILKELIKKFNINIDKVYSAPSLSLKIFIKKFNNDKIKFRHNFLLDKFIRKAYFGGRCEIYGNPKPNEYIYHFDFPGMYGLTMLQKFPYGKYKIHSNVTKIDKPGFYTIDFYSNMNLPILPHHRLLDKKLMFTNGHMTGTFWFEEIHLFIENGGTIKKIIHFVEFEKYDFIFKDFIEYFEEIRKKGSEYKTFSKLIVNSLYGRLGMDFIDSHSFFISKEKFKEFENSVDIINYIEINDFVLLECAINDKLKKKINLGGQTTKTNIAIAAAITSKARIKLYHAQKSVIKNNGRLLYSDTDSIIAAYDKDVSNEYHGEIFWDTNKKDTIINDAIFVNPKTYGLIYKDNTEIIKIKGYNQKNINFSELKNNFYKEKKIIIENFTFIKKTNMRIETGRTTKNFDLNNYDKRKWINKKTETIPLYYENYEYI